MSNAGNKLLGPGRVLKRMNMIFDPQDPVDQAFLTLYETCTDGVKLHLCKELILASLPKSAVEEDVLLARAMRRASNSRRGRPVRQSDYAAAPSMDVPRIPPAQVSHVVPAVTPASLVPAQPSNGVQLKDFAALAGVGTGWTVADVVSA